MGYNVTSVQITVRLSSHNDERDERDKALWAELWQAVANLAADPRYEDIQPSVGGELGYLE